MGITQEHGEYDDWPSDTAIGPEYTLIDDRFDDLYTRAACQGADDRKWFVGTYKGPTRQVGEASLHPEAVKVCHRCPVKKLCAAFAIETQPAYGVYAGRPACDWKRIVDGKKLRRTCDRCGRRRLDKFFADDEVPICDECMSLPPDDEMADLAQTMSEAELAAVLGVSERGVRMTKARLRRQGFPIVSNWWPSGGGRPRTVPGDDDLEEAFQEPVPASVLAERWGVTRSTVYFHKRRLAS